MLYSILEILATLIESTLILSAITVASRPRYPKTKQLLLMAGSIVGMTLLCIIANSIETFSFLTLLIGMGYAIFVTRFLTKGNLLLRCTATIIIFFFLNAFDYMIGFTCALVSGYSDNIFDSFSYLMQSGYLRVIYTLVNKTIQILACLVIFKYLRRLSDFGKRQLVFLFIAFLISYLTMSVLVNMIINDSLIIMQIAVIISWFFITIAMITILLLIAYMSDYYQKKQESQYLSIKNQLMEQNYQLLADQQTQLSQYIHDFSNHLKTLSAMTENTDNQTAHEYITSLLSVPKSHLSHTCHSGNKIIDAIINCKYAEAYTQNISFHYEVHLTDSLQISSLDICAILANQIDNAIEACMLIDDPQDRRINITIGQKNSFTFFKVVNSAKEDPFDQNHNLISKKGTSLHGLGIKNISEAVKKYDGTLENMYENHSFISIAIVQNINQAPET